MGPSPSPVSSPLHFLSHTQNSKICFKLAMHYSPTICILLPLNSEKACVNLSFKTASSWIHICPLMVTLGGTASAEPHLNYPHLMWAVTSQGCCSLAAPSCFCPVFRHEMKLKALFIKATEAAAELSIWGWYEWRKGSLVEVPKREKRHHVSWDLICAFSFHIALFLKRQCVLSPCGFPSSPIPQSEKLLWNWWYLLKPFWWHFWVFFF